MNTNHKLNKSSSDVLNDIQFSDLFDLNEIQHLQDLFADTHGVASVITFPDGIPITNPSNFCRLCNDIIRKTGKGRENCFKSDAAIGKQNSSGSIVQLCLSGGLWDAGASITVGGKHIANWLIGQVRNEEVDEPRMIQYADEIGVNRAEFMEALNEVPVMSVGQFNKVAKMLFAFANELSEKAYNNWQLKMQIAEREKATELLKGNEERFQLLFNKAPLGYQSLDFDGNLIEVNQHWLDTLGYTREEVIGKWFGDFLSPAYQDGFHLRFPIFKAQGKINSEFEMVHKNGNKLFIAFEGKIGYDLNGEFKQTHCILQDITERKRAEEALRENEAIQGKMVANIGDVILIIDQDGINRYKSPNIEKWFGWRPEDVVGESVWKNVHPDDLDSIQKLFSALLREPNATNTTECRYRCKDGSYKWIELTGINLLHDPDIRGLLGNYHDITKRKQAEEVLRESEAKLNLALQSASMSVWHWDIIEDRRYFDDQACYLLGINPATFTGSTEEFFRAVHPDDRQTIKEALSRTIEKDVLYEPEYRVVWPDKCIHYVAARGRLSRDDKGKPASINGIIWDITESKQKEEVLLKLKKAVDNSGEIIFLTDIEGIFTFVNPAFTSIYGFSADEIIGKVTPRILKSGLMEVNDYNLFWETLLSGKEVRGELINKRKDGTSIYIDSTSNPIFDENKNIIGFLGIQRDISGRKQAEQELIEAKERAEESDELKTAFLNNISHEIRTPFNGILGFLSIIQDVDLPNSERDEYIDLVNKSAYRLMNTINDIVEISQIQAGQMKLTASETNIKSLTGELFDHFITDAENQGLEFTINNDLDDSMDCIFTDRIKLKTVLSILIGNAIKFTKAGSVELGIHKKDAYLEFSVKDTGIGITENKQQVIFERFMQADVSNTRQFEGSGIGLSISTAYAEMLGGKIWVESEEGKGSVFYFTIPYNVEPEEKNVVKNVVSAEGAENEINPEISGLKILIVEDDQSSAKFVTLIVRKFSKEVLMVSNGLEAVKACRENPDIDLVLMDIQMPEMNGYEATRQIRQFNKEVIIIAQTAFGLTGDREKAMDAGCNDYISKPIKKDELLSVIRKHIEL